MYRNISLIFRYFLDFVGYISLIFEKIEIIFLFISIHLKHSDKNPEFCHINLAVLSVIYFLGVLIGRSNPIHHSFTVIDIHSSY